MSEDDTLWNEYRSMRDQMITRNINYIFRWKVMMIKLLLNDIQELQKKHNINVQDLYDEIRTDAEGYLKEWKELLEKRRKKILEVIESGQ
jgi:hypothetical protein